MKHRKGLQNSNTDALSRIPSSPQQTTDQSDPIRSKLSASEVVIQGECNIVQTRSASNQAKSTPVATQSQVQESPENFSLSGQDFDLQQHQQDDDIKRVMMTYLTEGYRPTTREIRQESSHMRRYIWNYDRIVTTNDILYRKW